MEWYYRKRGEKGTIRKIYLWENRIIQGRMNFETAKASRAHSFMPQTVKG